MRPLVGLIALAVIGWWFVQPSGWLRGEQADNDDPPPPPIFVQPDAGLPFEDIPHDPELEYLPPLEQELWLHGGSYLYAPEGDQLGWPTDDDHAHYEVLRLPETWEKPRPVEAFAEFLGADPIRPSRWHWLGSCGAYSWEPRFVGYGVYELFGFAYQQNDVRRDAIGQQLIVDLDLRLTGTERFHAQFRPLGRRNSGGSYYQFSDPEGYINNGTGEPDWYWAEGELHSLLGGLVDPFKALDYHVVAGRIPFAMHNFLLMNDDIRAVVINKNTIYLGELSNLNVQGIFAWSDVSTFADSDGRMYGVHVSADHRRAFYEGTYAFVQNQLDSSRDSHFAALSRTKMYGPFTVALRTLFKWGDSGGRGAGQLFVVETNRTRVFDAKPLGVEKGVFYCNAFFANDGWNSIGGGNFNRLTSAFEVDPLVLLTVNPDPPEVAGVVMGVQLFHLHEDESFVPEIAFQDVDGDAVFGAGLRYQRKLSARTFVEVLGVFNSSDTPALRRNGIFTSYFLLF